MRLAVMVLGLMLSAWTFFEAFLVSLLSGNASFLTLRTSTATRRANFSPGFWRIDRLVLVDAAAIPCLRRPDLAGTA